MAKAKPSWDLHKVDKRDRRNSMEWHYVEVLSLPFCDEDKLWDVLTKLYGSDWYFRSEMRPCYIIKTDVEMSLDDIKEVMMASTHKRDISVGWDTFRRRRSSSVERELEKEFEIEEEEEEPKSWNFVKKWFSRSSKGVEEDGHEQV